MTACDVSEAFPGEIFDQILDCLRASKHGLKACALTCKSFLPRSRYHIFGAVRLSRCNYARFLDLLRTAPCLATYIRTLSLRRSPLPPLGSVTTHLTDWTMTPILAEMHWISETCSTLPVPLSTVSRLDIETMTFSAEFIGVLRRNFCNVKEMRLGQCSFVTTSCFFELLTLPRLTNVVLADAYIKPSTVRMMLPYGNSSVPLAHEPVVPEINQDASRRANIRSLRFTSRVAYDVFAPQMLRWLTKEGTCRDLTVLDIPTLQENDITVLEETLRAVGSQLRELAVGFAMEVVMKWDGQRALLDLKHCTSLNVFTIRCLKFRISPIDVAEHVPSAYVTAVFSTLASPFLHTLNLRFRSAHIRIREDEHVIDWVTLCNTVLNLPTLRTNVRAPAQVMRLTNSKAHPLFRLNLEFYTRTSLMQDAYPAIRRGIAALTSDGRVGVQCMFQDPFRCTGPIWLTM